MRTHPFPSGWWRSPLLMSAALALVVVARDAAAGPIFEVSTTASASALFSASPDGGVIQEFGDAPLGVRKEAQIQIDYADGTIASFGAGSSYAGRGILRASGHGRVVSTVNGGSVGHLHFPWGGGGSGAARFRLDDLVVSPLIGGPLASSVPLSLNLNLHGSQIATASTNDASRFTSGSGGSSQVTLSGSLAGVSFSGTRTVRYSLGDTDATVEESGILAGFTGDDLLTTDTVNILVGRPFTLGLQLGASASGLALITHLSAEGDASFADTLSFPTSGPVFNLPNGFTVNSADGLIVNNNWVGAPAAVPEPTSLALLGTGALGLLGCGWRRRRGNAA